MTEATRVALGLGFAMQRIPPYRHTCIEAVAFVLTAVALAGAFYGILRALQAGRTIETTALSTVAICALRGLSRFCRTYPQPQPVNVNAAAERQIRAPAPRPTDG